MAIYYTDLYFFNTFLLGRIVRVIRTSIIIMKYGHYDEKPGLPDFALAEVTYKLLKVKILSVNGAWMIKILFE